MKKKTLPLLFLPQALLFLLLTPNVLSIDRVKFQLVVRRSGMLKFVP